MCLGVQAPVGEPFAQAAVQHGLALKIVDLPDKAARDLFQADLALIRPDQIVGWHGNASDDVDATLRKLTGRRAEL